MFLTIYGVEKSQCDRSINQFSNILTCHFVFDQAKKWNSPDQENDVVACEIQQPAFHR